MEYVNLGSSGLRVSRIALGMGLRGQSEADTARKVVRTALDNGVTLIDCANVYGFMDDRSNIGASEKLLGQLLKGRREEVVITSKGGSRVGPGQNDAGGSRLHIIRQVEASLKRLNTEWIDVYLLHSLYRRTPFDEQFRALETMVQQGKIRYTGVCNYQAWQVMAALSVQHRINACRLATVQNPYSLLDRSMEEEMFSMVRYTGVGIMAYSPLAVGLLGGMYGADSTVAHQPFWNNRPEALQRLINGRAGKVIEEVKSIAKERGVTSAQIAIGWLLSIPEISVVISGADDEHQIEDVIHSTSITLAPRERERLDKVSAGLKISFNPVAADQQR